MLQLWVAVIAAVSAVAGGWVSQRLTLKGVREQVTAQIAAQRSEQKAEHRLWLREKRAMAYEEFLDCLYKAVGHLRDFEKLHERDPGAARTAFDESGAALRLVEQSEANVAILGPGVVTAAAAHLHFVLDLWRYGHELELFLIEQGHPPPPDTDARRYGPRAAEQAVELFTESYTEATQVVLADDGTDVDRTRRLLTTVAEQVRASDTMLRERNGPFLAQLALPPLPNE
ncbi:hypothetical protein ACFYW6_32045 [Streptomyces sp. NPDC002659]|uniref:hypothetical protein n=1 Tax=Streptomyces sp. NPDC002659 TaxID=3364656 RepID=UPI003692DE6C